MRRMKPTHRALVFFSPLVVLSISACSSDDASTALDAATTLDSAPVDAGAVLAKAGSGTAFCDATLGAMVSATDGCCSSADRASTYYKQLVGAYQSAQKACGAGLEAGIASGRVTYDAASANACTASFTAALGSACGKDLFFALDLLASPSCRGAFGGLAEKGATCNADVECADGLTCAGNSSSSVGTCTEAAAIGGPCGSPKGAVSLQFGAHRACVVGSDCRGGVCTAARKGFECDLDRDCADGRLCVLGKCATARGPAGATCEVRDDCELGAYCDRSADAGTGTCAARKSQSASCVVNFAGGPQCHGRCLAGDAGSAGATCASFCGTP